MEREGQITELRLENSAPTVEVLDDLMPKLRLDGHISAIDLSNCNLKVSAKLSRISCQSANNAFLTGLETVYDYRLRLRLRLWQIV